MSSSLLSLRDFCGLATLTGQHKLISFRIDAHREMWRLIPFRLRLALQLTAASRHFPPARDNVRYLKAQTRPGPLSFPAAVDADCRSAHDHLTHHLRLLYHLAAEYIAVKPHCTPQVSRPDYILHTLYLHFSNAKHHACSPPALPSIWLSFLKRKVFSAFVRRRQSSVIRSAQSQCGPIQIVTMFRQRRKESVTEQRTNRHRGLTLLSGF